jgi:hypothetical protein
MEAHRPVHELTLGNLLSEDQGDILMATVATDDFKQRSHNRFIALKYLHKPSILVDKKPGHSDLQVFPLGLGQQAQQLRLAETDRRGTDINEMKHGLPHFNSLLFIAMLMVKPSALWVLYGTFRAIHKLTGKPFYADVLHPRDICILRRVRVR